MDSLEVATFIAAAIALGFDMVGVPWVTYLQPQLSPCFVIVGTFFHVFGASVVSLDLALNLTGCPM